MTIVIKTPDGEILYIPIGKDIELGKVGKIGETINEYFYCNVLAYNEELSNYSGCLIRKSIIIGIDWIMKVKVIFDRSGWNDLDLVCIDSMPTIIDIPNDIKEEDVTDYISDETGWCIESWFQVE